jgi:phage terminase large subunit-like protein
VAPTAADARDVMVEGESGLVGIRPDEDDDERPIYEPSKRRLTWPNGAIATTYSADEPERLPSDVLGKVPAECRASERMAPASSRLR